MGCVRVSCQRGGSEKCLATVTVDREGVGPEVRSLWAKLGSRPQLCSLEDKQTEVNPYHGMSKGILACGGKATLLKAEENSQSSESEKKKFQKALARNTHRAEVIRRDSAERRRYWSESIKEMVEDKELKV